MGNTAEPVEDYNMDYCHNLDAFEDRIKSSTAANFGRLKADALGLLQKFKECRARLLELDGELPEVVQSERPREWGF